MTDTITLPRSVVEQALETLNASMPHNNDMDEDWPSHIAARRALRAALEQQQVEQEPVAWMTEDGRIATDTTKKSGMASTSKPSFNIPLYTHPQPRREPLTAEQIADIEDMFSNEFGLEAKHAVDFARAIERAHGIGE